MQQHTILKRHAHVTICLFHSQAPRGDTDPEKATFSLKNIPPGGLFALNCAPIIEITAHQVVREECVVKKTWIVLPLALCMLLSLSACGLSGSGSASTGTAEPADISDNTITLANSFAYSSLDVHKDYYGWYTAIYGVAESLFKMGDDASIQPCLAESAAVDSSGLVWTIRIQPKACFSNGNPLTADMVKRNLERLAELNSRFAYIGDFTFDAIDATTLLITTEDTYPTMLNDLASPEFGMMDLDNTEDFDLAPICTGPFVIKSFEPEGTCVVRRNENYWNGEVKLDGATFLYMVDDDSKLMAMQNGEIDGYTSVTATAMEIFAADPDAYTLTSIPATRLQFYAMNHHTMDSAVREAVNLTVDKDSIALFLNGTVSATDGPFAGTKLYGKVNAPAPDAEKVRSLLERDGYTLNADGIYEKDGKPLCLHICYYAARSLDSLATLIQDQLRAAGIDSTLTCEEDPDATYLTTGDYDIALYCSIADKSGDPYYFIDGHFRSNCWWNLDGFANDECDALIDELKYETDAVRRAELANRIVQITIDGSDFGYIGLFNKITVTRVGLSGLSETSPFDFYFLTADTALD